MRLSVAVILLLAGCCGSKPELVIPEAPDVVRVAVPQYVALPAELTGDCYNEGAKLQTYNEAKRLANLRNASIEECNKRWSKVRELQPVAKP